LRHIDENPSENDDEHVRCSIEGLSDRIDGTAVTRSSEESLAARPWNRDVWAHGDLLPGNLLVKPWPTVRSHRLGRTQCR